MPAYPLEKAQVMDFPTIRPSSRQPRLAIIASFTLIAVFVVWLILPRSAIPQDDVLPIPVASKVCISLQSHLSNPSRINSAPDRPLPF